MQPRTHDTRGFGVIEIVIGVAILSIALFGLLAASQNFVLLSRRTNDLVQANFLLSEGVESIRVMRDSGWTAYIAPLTVGGTYSPYFDGSTWVSTTTPQIVDGRFERTFVVSAVERNTSDDIVASGGTVDPDTKKFTVQVSWHSDARGTTTLSFPTYFTNMHND